MAEEEGEQAFVNRPDPKRVPAIGWLVMWVIVSLWCFGGMLSYLAVGYAVRTTWTRVRAKVTGMDEWVEKGSRRGDKVYQPVFGFEVPGQGLKQVRCEKTFYSAAGMELGKELDIFYKDDIGLPDTVWAIWREVIWTASAGIATGLFAVWVLLRRRAAKAFNLRHGYQ